MVCFNQCMVRDMITKSSDDIWGEHAIGRKAKALFITRRAPPHLIGKPIDRSGLAPPIWQLTGNPFIRTPFLGQPPLHSRITSQCFQGKVVAQSTVKSSLALSHRQKPQNISHFQFIISVILDEILSFASLCCCKINQRIIEAAFYQSQSLISCFLKRFPPLMLMHLKRQM